MDNVIIPGLEIDEYLTSAIRDIPSPEKKVFQEFEIDLSHLPLNLRRICRGGPVAPFVRPSEPRTYTMHLSCRDHELWLDRMQIWEYWPYLRREMLLFFYEKKNIDITHPLKYSQAVSVLKELQERLTNIISETKAVLEPIVSQQLNYCLFAFGSTARQLDYICKRNDPECREEVAALLEAELSSTRACLEMLNTKGMSQVNDESLIFSQYVLQEKLKNLKGLAESEETCKNKINSVFLKWALPSLPDEKPYEFKANISSEMYSRTNIEKHFPTDEEFEIDSSWTLTLETSKSQVLENACKSFKNRIRKSFGVELDERKSVKNYQGKQIIVCTSANRKTVDQDLHNPKDYRVKYESGNLIVCGGEEAGSMFALYYLEYLFFMRGSLCLKKDLNIVRHSLFDVRITMTQMGWMQWPDEYLEMLPRYGIDGIYISSYANICGGQRCRGICHLQSPEKVHRLIKRAKKWGLKIYCQFVNQGAPGDEIDDESLLKKMLREFPQIDGLIFLTEGFSAEPEKVNKLAEIAKQINPEIDIIVWNYNGAITPKHNKQKIDFTKQCSLKTIQMLTWVKGAKSEFNNEWRYVYDYSISVIGPSEVWAAKKLEIEKNKGAEKIYARADAWNNWQFGTLPYLPFPQQWLKRHDSLVKNSINGSLDSWTHGFTPNFIAEIKSVYCWDNAPSREKLLREIAFREFGINNTEQIIKAWALFSEGIQQVPDTGHGILCNACAAPLFFEKPPLRMWQSEEERARSKKTMYAVTANAYWPYAPQWAFLLPDFSNRRNMAKVYAKSYLDFFERQEGEKGFSLETFLNQLDLAAEKFEQGLILYRNAAGQSPKSHKKGAIKQVLIAEQIKKMLLSEKAILQFENFRFMLYQDNSEKKVLIDQMTPILEEELERTCEVQAIIKKDSRMGYQWEADYFYTPYVLKQKIDLINDTLNRQIPEFVETNNL